MATTINEVLNTKRGVDIALDDVTQEIWGEEIEPEVEPLDQRRINIAEMTKYLSRIHGQRIASQLCGEQSLGLFKKWMTMEGDPNEWQLRFMKFAFEITMILSMRLNKSAVKTWFGTRNEYLAGFTPTALFQSDPQGVRMAAMDFLMTVHG